MALMGSQFANNDLGSAWMAGSQHNHRQQGKSLPRIPLPDVDLSTTTSCFTAEDTINLNNSKCNILMLTIPSPFWDFYTYFDNRMTAN